MRFTEEVTIEPDNGRGEVSWKSRDGGAGPLIAVVGPTGSGKSELAIALARRFGGEIVNFDSVQLYRGLDIGAAKLSLARRAEVPHHLIDVADARAELTAGAYAQMARPILRQIAGRGAVPILVGGTGLYLRALLDGLSPGPQRDEPLRERLRLLSQRRPAALSRYLYSLGSDQRRPDSPAGSTEVDSGNRDDAIDRSARLRTAGSTARPFAGIRCLQARFRTGSNSAVCRIERAFRFDVRAGIATGNITAAPSGDIARCKGDAVYRVPASGCGSRGAAPA